MNSTSAPEECEPDEAQACKVESPIAGFLDRYTDVEGTRNPRDDCEHNIVIVKEDASEPQCHKPEKFQPDVAPYLKDVASLGRKNYKSCAVVGGSAKLLTCNLGHEIDEHEA